LKALRKKQAGDCPLHRRRGKGLIQQQKKFAATIGQKEHVEQDKKRGAKSRLHPGATTTLGLPVVIRGSKSEEEKIIGKEAANPPQPGGGATKESR